MSMDEYIRSNAIDIAKGIIVSGFLVCTLALASGGGADPSASMYDTGKKIFLERVVCDTCPYASLELNSDKSPHRVAQPATRPETGGSDRSGIIVVATHFRKTLYQKAFLPLTGRRQGSGLGNVVQIMEHEHSGRLKSEWAGNIARHLDSECARSKSFQVFRRAQKSGGFGTYSARN